MLIVLAGIPVFEREHHAAEERVELLLLAIGERLGEQRLLLALDVEGLLVRAPALLGQLDEHAAPVARIAQTADEAPLLERVEAAGHRAARQLGAPRELPRLAAVRRP